MRNRKKILVSVGGFFVLVFLVAICFNVSKFFNFQVKNESSSVKLVNTSQEEDTSKKSVTLKFTYSPMADMNVSSESELSTFRSLSKEYYKENNRDFLTRLGYDKSIFDYDTYSPYVFASYDAYYSMLDRLKANYLASNLIETLYIDDISDQEENGTSNILNATNHMSIETAKNMIGLSSPAYTGEGIKIGVLEKYYPGYMNTPKTNIESNIQGCLNNFTALSTITQNDLQNNHPYQVGSIIAGNVGVAENASLYYASSLYSQLRNSVNWMLSNNVKIINISTTTSSNTGRYTGSCAYLDYISKYNKVIIVSSAGNNANYVIDPSAAFNSIVVGAVDKNKNAYSANSYKTENNDKKPLLSAPGVDLYLNSRYLTGTSFATPFVTGIVALLLDEFPELINTPDLLISYLILGSTSANNQGAGNMEKVGAGIINYSNTRDIIINRTDKVCRISATTSNLSGDIIYDDYINVGSDGIITLAYYFTSDTLLYTGTNEEMDDVQSQIAYSQTLKTIITFYDAATDEEILTISPWQNYYYDSINFEDYTSVIVQIKTLQTVKKQQFLCIHID